MSYCFNTPLCMTTNCMNGLETLLWLHSLSCMLFVGHCVCRAPVLFVVCAYNVTGILPSGMSCERRSSPPWRTQMALPRTRPQRVVMTCVRCIDAMRLRQELCLYTRMEHHTQIYKGQWRRVSLSVLHCFVLLVTLSLQHRYSCCIARVVFNQNVIVERTKRLNCTYLIFHGRK